MLLQIYPCRPKSSVNCLVPGDACPTGPRYYCSSGTKRKCDSGATLEDIVNDLFSRQLLKGSCLPYKAQLGLSGAVCKTSSCNDMNLQASKGNFEAVTLRNPYDVMEHIRMYGSVVSPRAGRTPH